MTNLSWNFHTKRALGKLTKAGDYVMLGRLPVLSLNVLCYSPQAVLGRKPYEAHSHGGPCRAPAKRFASGSNGLGSGQSSPSCLRIAAGPCRFSGLAFLLPVLLLCWPTKSRSTTPSKKQKQSQGPRLIPIKIIWLINLWRKLQVIDIRRYKESMAYQSTVSSGKKWLSWD